MPATANSPKRTPNMLLIFSLSNHAPIPIRAREINQDGIQFIKKLSKMRLFSKARHPTMKRTQPKYFIRMFLPPLLINRYLPYQL